MSPPDDATEVVIGWVLKVGGVIVTFIGGIVTATATITLKMKGYDDRIQSLEKNQEKCQGVVLKNIADQLDNLPDKIDEKMERRINRVHDRIDTLVLREKSHDDESIKRDKQALKGIEDVRENQ